MPGRGSMTSLEPCRCIMSTSPLTVAFSRHPRLYLQVKRKSKYSSNTENFRLFHQYRRKSHTKMNLQYRGANSICTSTTDGHTQ
ncbi:hypothetical protein DPMN_146732 [Dreissena polymorpha]|uniref:Uncharacterized protein n=1 Tax=Dreissena polymorpha TaxID=45954 RepID=A0A9D4FAV9_DREPO|nr:hypothetical protein DPMN_146732 [Dreissena polymorpha]